MSEEDIPPNPETQARFEKLEQLTIKQIKAAIMPEVPPEPAILGAAECLVDTMIGKSTLEVTAIGLVLVMLGLELCARGVMKVGEMPHD